MKRISARGTFAFKWVLGPLFLFLVAKLVWPYFLDQGWTPYPEIIPYLDLAAAAFVVLTYYIYLLVDCSSLGRLADAVFDSGSSLIVKDAFLNFEIDYKDIQSVRRLYEHSRYLPTFVLVVYVNSDGAGQQAVFAAARPIGDSRREDDAIDGLIERIQNDPDRRKDFAEIPQAALDELGDEVLSFEETPSMVLAEFREAIKSAIIWLLLVSVGGRLAAYIFWLIPR